MSWFAHKFPARRQGIHNSSTTQSIISRSANRNASICQQPVSLEFIVRRGKSHKSVSVAVHCFPQLFLTFLITDLTLLVVYWIFKHIIRSVVDIDLLTLYCFPWHHHSFLIVQYYNGKHGELSLTRQNSSHWSPLYTSDGCGLIRTIFSLSILFRFHWLIYMFNTPWILKNLPILWVYLSQ